MAIQEVVSIQSNGEFIDDICGDKIIYLPNDTQVKLLGVEHSTKFFRANEMLIDREINKASFVASEVGFDELIDQNRDLIPVVEDDLAFFQEIHKRAWIHNKPLLYVDPQLGLLNAVELGAGVGEASLLWVSLLNMLWYGTKMTRRQFLKVSGNFLASIMLFSTNTFGRDLLLSRFIPDCNQEPLPFLVRNPMAYDDYRNSATVLGLYQSARHNYCQGNGIYIVGDYHVKQYLAYGESGDLAE